ncbi:MAG TPA: response regulator transcription factor [Acidimicrobiales bacterium]|jgi:DNA-binding NarL/FixJ family response regulator|nr:response regulator transcription factor [Acidimicrobiales bacterium]
MSQARILIADDHPVMRDGLRRTMESYDIDVLETVADGRAAVAAVERLHPDAVLMDISMPAMDGIAATEIIRSRHADVVVICLTFHGDDAVHQKALEAGASIVLTKDVPAEDVVSVLLEVLAGEPVVERRSDRSRHGGELSLTAREIEILALITKGASTTRIGSELFISVKTVKNHLASIYEKLDVTDRTQAVLSALRLGLVSLDS